MASDSDNDANLTTAVVVNSSLPSSLAPDAYFEGNSINGSDANLSVAIINSSSSSSLTRNALIERNTINGINIILSLVGIWGNVTVVTLVSKNANLRVNCKYLQAALAAGDSVLCFGQVTNSSLNIIIANLAPKIIRWQCLLYSTHGAVSTMYSMFMTVFIALDRCIAVVFPNRYRLLRKSRVCAYCVLISFTVSGALGIASYMDVNLYDYPSGCVGSASRSAAMSFLINYVNASAGLVVLVAYPFILAAMKYKAGQVSSFTGDAARDNNTRYFLKQVEATASITCVIMASLTLYVIPNLLVIILKFYDIQPMLVSKAHVYIGFGTSIHSGINCAFYLWKDAKMREAFMKLYSIYKAAPTSSNPVAPSLFMTG